MSVTCPEGHLSEATDYCDTCGTPIGAGNTAGSTSGPGAGAGQVSSVPGPSIPHAAERSVLDLDPSPAPTQTCPHCGAVNIADALFCEACGYDFTTGAAPLGDEPEGGEEPAEGRGDPGGGEEPSEGRGDPEGVEPVRGEPQGLEEPDGGEEPEPDDEPAEVVGQKSAQVPDPAVTEQPAAEPSAAESPGPGTRETAAHVRPRHTPPSRALADTWVVEVWVDPDWYAVQQTEEACPSPGLPDVVLVRRNVVLVGRPSGSRGVRPDVDAGADSAVSRRHAQLTSDGSRWWVEDLGSSNGTYVGSVGEPLPTGPIRQRVEIDRDDRIYVGAWTRLVLRQATASERAGQG